MRTLIVLMLVSVPLWAQEIQVAPMAFVSVPIAGNSAVTYSDSAWYATGEDVPTLRVPINVPAVIKGGLFVGIPVYTTGSDRYPTGVVLSSGGAFTLLDSTAHTVATYEKVFIYYRLGTSAGLDTVVITYNDNMPYPNAAVELYYNVNQSGGSSTFGTVAKSQGIGTAIDLSVTSTSVNDKVLVFQGIFSGTTIAPDAGTTKRGESVYGSLVARWFEANGASGSVAVGGDFAVEKRWMMVGVTVKP